jgi:hypothetical protein
VINESITINFPKSKTPDILVNGTMYGKVMNWKLEELKFFTPGAGTEKLILSALEEKYGSPSSLRMPEMQTLGGARINGMRAIWNFTNLKVTFKSALQQVDEGSVVIETPTAIAREAADLPKGPKL